MEATPMNAPEDIKILAFAAQGAAADEARLRKVLSSEIAGMRMLLGARMTAMCGIAPGADLIFLRACVELRIPVIVILPSPEARLAADFADKGEWKLAQDLMSVALAKYVAPAGAAWHLPDWADVILGAGSESGETMRDARELGIPLRIVDPASFDAKWDVPLDASRRARHGFGARADLLDFLDARFAAPLGDDR